MKVPGRRRRGRAGRRSSRPDWCLHVKTGRFFCVYVSFFRDGALDRKGTTHSIRAKALCEARWRAVHLNRQSIGLMGPSQSSWCPDFTGHTQPEIGCRPTAWPACGRRLWPGGHPCLGLITGGPAADSSGHSSPRKTAVTTHTLAQKDVQLAAGKPFISWHRQAESAISGQQLRTADRRGKGKRPERLPSRGGGCRKANERKDHRFSRSSCRQGPWMMHL